METLKPKTPFCIPIVARDSREAISKMARASQKADIFEIRLDMMERFDLEKILGHRPRPVLVTYRSRAQGGEGTVDAKTCAHYLLEALKHGAEYVDLELTLPQPLRQKIFEMKGASNIIMSMHIADFTPPCRDLEMIFREMVRTGADIMKIVTFARSWEDNLEVLGLIRKARKMGIDIIAFCMGPMGRISRITSHLMGGAMTFVSLSEEERSAPGQIPIDEMKEILE